MKPTDFEIELPNGSLVRATDLLSPDEHTATYIRERLRQVLHDQCGIDVPEIKMFRYRI